MRSSVGFEVMGGGGGKREREERSGIDGCGRWWSRDSGDREGGGELVG